MSDVDLLNRGHVIAGHPIDRELTSAIGPSLTRAMPRSQPQHQFGGQKKISSTSGDTPRFPLWDEGRKGCFKDMTDGGHDASRGSFPRWPPRSYWMLVCDIRLSTRLLPFLLSGLPWPDVGQCISSLVSTTGGASLAVGFFPWPRGLAHRAEPTTFHVAEPPGFVRSLGLWMSESF